MQHQPSLQNRFCGYRTDAQQFITNRRARNVQIRGRTTRPVQCIHQKVLFPACYCSPAPKPTLLSWHRFLRLWCLFYYVPNTWRRNTRTNWILVPLTKCHRAQLLRTGTRMPCIRLEITNTPPVSWIRAIHGIHRSPYIELVFQYHWTIWLPNPLGHMSPRI